MKTDVIELHLIRWMKYFWGAIDSIVEILLSHDTAFDVIWLRMLGDKDGLGKQVECNKITDTKNKLRAAKL